MSGSKSKPIEIYAQDAGRKIDPKTGKLYYTDGSKTFEMERAKVVGLDDKLSETEIDVEDALHALSEAEYNVFNKGMGSVATEYNTFQEAIAAYRRIQEADGAFVLGTEEKDDEVVAIRKELVELLEQINKAMSDSNDALKTRLIEDFKAKAERVGTVLAEIQSDKSVAKLLHEQHGLLVKADPSIGAAPIVYEVGTAAPVSAPKPAVVKRGIKIVGARKPAAAPVPAKVTTKASAPAPAPAPAPVPAVVAVEEAVKPAAPVKRITIKKPAPAIAAVDPVALEYNAKTIAGLKVRLSIATSTVAAKIAGMVPAPASPDGLSDLLAIIIALIDGRGGSRPDSFAKAKLHLLVEEDRGSGGPVLKSSHDQVNALIDTNITSMVVGVRLRAIYNELFGAK